MFVHSNKYTKSSAFNQITRLRTHSLSYKKKWRELKFRFIISLVFLVWFNREKCVLWGFPWLDTDKMRFIILIYGNNLVFLMLSYPIELFCRRTIVIQLVSITHFLSCCGSFCISFFAFCCCCCLSFEFNYFVCGGFSLPICRNDCLSRRWWLSTRCWWFNQSHLLFDFLQCVWLGTGKTPKIWLFGDLERGANVQNKNHYKCTHFKWCD